MNMKQIKIKSRVISERIRERIREMIGAVLRTTKELGLHRSEGKRSLSRPISRARDLFTPSVSIGMRSVSCFLSAIFLLSSSFTEFRAVPVSTSVTIESGSGAPLVQINRAGEHGTSFNQYSTFSVDRQGLILNNVDILQATAATTTVDRGREISVNPNFADGSAASLVVNEVIGASPARTLLDGYTEIAGQRAGFILVNPRGISCNGCGFINMSGVTLSTSNAGGYDADTGSYQHRLRTASTVELNGLSASRAGAVAAERFNIISRAVLANGTNALSNSTKLSLYLGALDIREISGNDFDGEGPVYASGADAYGSYILDVQSLGSLESGSIYMIATENGMGVRVASRLIANSGSLSLDLVGSSLGKILVEDEGVLSATASGDLASDVVLSARDIKNEGTILSKGNIILDSTGGTFVNNGRIWRPAFCGLCFW